MHTDQIGRGDSVIAVVGAPNSGKTTLFNWLTGSKFKTVNYPGSTVDCYRGSTLPNYGATLDVLDTPGVYSLQPQARDEEVTRNVLVKPSEIGFVASAIIVVDGMQLARQLYLVRQIQQMKIPFVLAVTMADLLRKSGMQLDQQKLSELINAPVVMVDGTLGGGVKQLVEAVRNLKSQKPNLQRDFVWDSRKITEEQKISEDWANTCIRKVKEGNQLAMRLRSLDRWFLHPIFGVFTFIAIMTIMFSSIFWLAAPAMDWVDGAISWTAAQVYLWLGPNSLSDFLSNGVIAGFGAILVFVPQIFILFFGFTILEDSGYLARAATIVDRPFQKIGLSGRAFVPILSSFACAVPGVLAARNLRSKRERWITIFILPLMTCSARLPVYALLLTFLFAGEPAWKPGLALAGLYLASLIIGAIAAAILNRMLKVSADSHFLMELPFYRMPKWRVVLRTALLRTTSYVTKAGPTIFVLVLILWVGTHYPHIPGASESEQLQKSYVGQLGQMIEPVFEPMGLDWRGGLGLMSAFVAREVFVSALAVIFNIADVGEDSLQKNLIEKMHHASNADGMYVFTNASVLGLIVFFMIALQCLSTTGVTAKEMASWKFAVIQLIAWNVLAYILAVGVVQLALRI